MAAGPAQQRAAELIAQGYDGPGLNAADTQELLGYAPHESYARSLPAAQVRSSAASHGVQLRWMLSC